MASWSMHRPPSGIFSFRGFRFDPESGELTQNGIRIRLGKQCADILAVIILNAGSLVTRETLRQVLWPGGEMVMHEKIINNAISRLRYIFQDDAQTPTFIERVPKRGYRWIMPVEELERGGAALQKVADTTTELALSESSSRGLEDLRSTSPRIVPLPDDGFYARARPARRWWLRFAVGGVLVLLMGVGLFFWPRQKAATSHVPQQIIALAVAPLDTSGAGAPELAESFRLDLTDALAQLPHVEVRAAHSVNQLHLTDASYSTYSSKLGLDVLLFGNFSVTGHLCQLQFELVRAKDATHLATLRYSGTVDQLSSIRDRIEQDVFTKLQIAGTSGGHPRGSTSDSEAYKSYLEAKYQFSQQTRESLGQSVNDYSLAIERDPNFAKAYVGLAQTQLIRLSDDYITPQEGFAQATAAVKKALLLDDSNAQVHSILGFIRFYRDWDFLGAIEEDRQAIRLDPHQAIYHQWLAVLLSDAGRYHEAFSEIDIAQREDPYWPSLYTTETYIALNARDYKRMLAAAKKLKELLPDSTMPYDVMANALWYGGHYEEGIAEWRRMAVREGDQERVKLEDAGLEAFRAGGVPAYAKVRIQAITSGHEATRDPSDFDPFEWYMAAGDHKAALMILKAKMANRDHVLFEIMTGPFSDPIRNDPEFVALFDKTGLPARQLSPNN